VGTGASLAGRLPGPDDYIMTNEPPAELGRHRLWIIVPPEGPYIKTTVAPLPGVHTRFPYGFAVPPDVPM